LSYIGGGRVPKSSGGWELKFEAEGTTKEGTTKTKRGKGIWTWMLLGRPAPLFSEIMHFGALDHCCYGEFGN